MPPGSHKPKARLVHPYAWVWERLEEDPTFVLRPMFGAKSVYLRGRIMLCCTTGEEPWNGILVCTAREYHASLLKEFPGLVEHPVLGKWLYLSEKVGDFERTANALVRLIREHDPRIGVVPKPKRTRRSRGDRP